MTAAEPTRIFPCLYKNGKYDGESAEDHLDFASMPGHLFRDAATAKFLYFENLDVAGRYIIEQKKPMLHSVVNKTLPIQDTSDTIVLGVGHGLKIVGQYRPCPRDGQEN